MTDREFPRVGNCIHTAHLTVQSDHVEAFRESAGRHAEVSRGEPGCLGFDVYQSEASASLFFFFEIYRDLEALDAHRKSAHFLAFRQAVDGWVTGRRWWQWSQIA